MFSPVSGRGQPKASELANMGRGSASHLDGFFCGA